MLAIGTSGHRRFAGAKQQTKNSSLPEGMASAILCTHATAVQSLADERGRSSLPTTCLPIVAGASLLAPIHSFQIPKSEIPRIQGRANCPNRADLPPASRRLSARTSSSSSCQSHRKISISRPASPQGGRVESDGRLSRCDAFPAAPPRRTGRADVPHPALL